MIKSPLQSESSGTADDDASVLAKWYISLAGQRIQSARTSPRTGVVAAELDRRLEELIPITISPTLPEPPPIPLPAQVADIEHQVGLGFLLLDLASLNQLPLMVARTSAGLMLVDTLRWAISEEQYQGIASQFARLVNPVDRRSGLADTLDVIGLGRRGVASRTFRRPGTRSLLARARTQGLRPLEAKRGTALAVLRSQLTKAIRRRFSAKDVTAPPHGQTTPILVHTLHQVDQLSITGTVVHSLTSFGGPAVVRPGTPPGRFEVLGAASAGDYHLTGFHRTAFPKGKPDAETVFVASVGAVWVTAQI